MDYKYLDNSIYKNDDENIILPSSDKIDQILLKNNDTEIIKVFEFLSSNEEKVLHLHGFLGTGKRQLINYIEDFLTDDVVELKYYCKEGTVCDDIMLKFINVAENLSLSRAININSKIITLTNKLSTYINSIKKPFLIVLQSLDDMLPDNITVLTNYLADLSKQKNIKIIVLTRAMTPKLLGTLQEDKKVFLKAFSQDNFKLFLESHDIAISTDTILNDFYKYTRGYYYYTALSVKIMQTLKMDISVFLEKFNSSGMSFDDFVGWIYLTFVPQAILNLFWFLVTIRHGISIDALIELEIYDELSCEYLNSHLMTFTEDGSVYVQDYFIKQMDIIIPENIEIKMHKYIINIYEKQLGLAPRERLIFLSRQSLRADIEYHKEKIKTLEEHKKSANNVPEENNTLQPTVPHETTIKDVSLEEQFKQVTELVTAKNFTKAIEILQSICEKNNDTKNIPFIEAKLKMAEIYKHIEDFQNAIYCYEIVEKYYLTKKEVINLNYLHYDLAYLYFKTYKTERAIKTITQVIYSVDTPKSLLVNSCVLLGNIYSEINKPQEAFSYYEKAIASLDEDANQNILPELYFKFALANDDLNNMSKAFEYYNKCICITDKNDYLASAYSNIGSCYLENNNLSDAKICLKKAYEYETRTNNYYGIYYNAKLLAEILQEEKSPEALDYLLEAKKSAEFINAPEYILESSIALGDYYYNSSTTSKIALKEYLEAKRIAEMLGIIEIDKIAARIKDMQLRMSPNDFEEIEQKVASKN